MISTSSLHVRDPTASRDRLFRRNRSNTLIQILLHCPPNLATGTMQEDSLVCLCDVEDVTDLPRAPAVHVPQRDHLPLARGEGVDGLGKVIEALPGEEPRFRSAFPARRELGPSARPPVVRPSEPAGIDRGLRRLLGRIEQGGEGDGSSFALATG